MVWSGSKARTVGAMDPCMFLSGGPSGTLFELVGERMEENTRLGQAFVLFELLSGGGGGLFVPTKASGEGTFLTCRRVAVGLAGYGLPAVPTGSSSPPASVPGTRE